jgi:hypothetical protein
MQEPMEELGFTMDYEWKTKLEMAKMVEWKR